MQDYLKTIYVLQQQGGNVSTSMLADQMGIMIKKLASLEMVEHEPYRGVRLLPAGEQIALETLRHHRLLELFLTEILGFSWDEVHEEADRLEHHISEALEARISAVLGEPTHDPHGDPIPTLTGRVPVLEMHPLPALGTGNSGIVARVATQDDEILRYLGRLGLGLNVQVELLDVAPFNGPLTVRVEDEREISLARELSEKVLVLHVVQPGE
jgi:DtxR family transcriptional regulator, Mn-dependent transcriptional regulator